MRTKRSAPDSEWVQMYRQGVTTSKIAATAGVSQSTVRYHLAIGAAAEPSLRARHRMAQSTTPHPRVTTAGLQNLNDTIALYQAEDRLPSTKSASPRERALAVWLLRRRQDHDRNVLSPTYRDGLQTIPGWEHRTRASNDEARWNQRIAELSDYIAAGHDWPRHKKTHTKEERVLGMWLHIQRMQHRRSKLSYAREMEMNTHLPGWLSGRVRGRQHRT